MRGYNGKWTAALLTAAMSASVLAGCGGGGGNGGSENPPAPGESTSPSEALANLNESGMPIVKEPINLTFFTGKPTGNSNDYREVRIWQEYAKMSNINVDFQLVPTGNVSERKNLVLSGGDYPDVFYRANFNNIDLIKYGSQGTFIALNDLIDQYAPNLKKIMDENPDIRKGMTMPDGNIYGLPLIYDADFTSVLLGTKLWYNKDWLEALGMEEPQTLDEFYNYLAAVKNTDLNGNGQLDEVPLGSNDFKDLLNVLKGSYGLMNRGWANPNVDIDPETGELRYIPISDRMKELLEFLNKLYSEGLLDQEVFTLGSAEFYAKGVEEVFGAMLIQSPESLMGLTNYAGFPVLEGPHGDKMMTKVRSPLGHTGPFVITDKNPYPEATVRWMDYFYGEEGNKMFFMGIEGESHVVNENGEVEYTEEIVNNPQGLNLDQAIQKYVIWPGGGYPGIVREQFFKGGESLPESLEAAEKIKPYMVEEVWPAFIFTIEESDRFNALHSDINTYVEEMQAKFISGSAPFSEWDNFVNTIKRMGLDDYMSLYEAAYERYSNN